MHPLLFIDCVQYQNDVYSVLVLVDLAYMSTCLVLELATYCWAWFVGVCEYNYRVVIETIKSPNWIGLKKQPNPIPIMLMLLFSLYQPSQSKIYHPNTFISNKLKGKCYRALFSVAFISNKLKEKY